MDVQETWGSPRVSARGSSWLLNWWKGIGGGMSLAVVEIIAKAGIKKEGDKGHEG